MYKAVLCAVLLGSCLLAVSANVGGTNQEGTVCSESSLCSSSSASSSRLLQAISLPPQPDIDVDIFHDLETQAIRFLTIAGAADPGPGITMTNYDLAEAAQTGLRSFYDERQAARDGRDFDRHRDRSYYEWSVFVREPGRLHPLFNGEGNWGGYWTSNPQLPNSISGGSLDVRHQLDINGMPVIRDMVVFVSPAGEQRFSRQDSDAFKYGVQSAEDYVLRQLMRTDVVNLPELAQSVLDGYRGVRRPRAVLAIPTSQGVPAHWEHGWIRVMDVGVSVSKGHVFLDAWVRPMRGMPAFMVSVLPAAPQAAL